MADLDPAFVRRVLDATDPGADPADAAVLADAFLEKGDLRGAASALDRAFGLAPDDRVIRDQRTEVLDALAVEEHGLRFRYVPAGPFLMGSATGEADERPVHVARTAEYWVTDTPVTWAQYCALLLWEPPPRGIPRDGRTTFGLREENKIRRQYCGTSTEDASSAHETFTAAEYDTKPMISVSWRDALEAAAAGSGDRFELRLPTEPEWEKAARGGLIGARFSWGNEPADLHRCDFDRFGDFRLTDPRRYPANGYGLHAMCGGVWEWTGDPYDALAYRNATPQADRTDLAPRVLRGGSWSDCADACTVSFRMSRTGASWRDGTFAQHDSPNIGFRLVRVAR